MSVNAKLAQLGIRLPHPALPVANYVPYKILYDHTSPAGLLYTSGMIPLVEGQPLYTGKVGREVTLEQGAECARAATLNALAWASAALAGNLDRVAEVVRVNGYVASAEDFFEQPKVLNGCSDLLVALFGEAGKHTRVAVGTCMLPLNVPVELDFIFRVC